MSPTEALLDDFTAGDYVFFLMWGFGHGSRASELSMHVVEAGLPSIFRTWCLYENALWAELLDVGCDELDMHDLDLLQH